MEKPNIKPKKRPTKIEEMSKEQIRQAIVKKRECNTKALKIVENLLEIEVAQEYFLKCLPDINQSHLEDIIEERTIQRLCGYPLCPNELVVTDIPKQKYRISVKTNKVYDITGRKNFCSNICYKAAIYVKNQMLTSPLWFRNYEQIPVFTLMPLDSIGSLGQEVDVALVQKATVASEKISQFTSINEFANASLHEITEDDSTEQCDKIDDNNSKEETKNSNIINKDNLENNNKQKNEITKPSTEKKMIVKTETKKVPTVNPLNIVGNIIEKPERKIDPILTDPPAEVCKSKPVTKKTPKKKQPAVTVIAVEVEKCLAEWLTLDTMLLLFGEDRVREMVTDKKDSIDKYLNSYTNSIFYNSNSYDQYQTLYRKLNLLELEERQGETPKELKPLPDYSILQEESKKLQLKVRAFFSGELEIPDPVEKKIDDDTQSEEVPNLPLVDKNAQNALRRRIVLQHLNKVLPDLLRSLGLETLSICSDVRILVNTFKLKANNIMFKPIQWTLIAIIVIKLLSLRDHQLQYFLKQPTAFQHMQLLLLSYKQDGGYLDRLISWLTDIDRVLQTNDRQLTVE